MDFVDIGLWAAMILVVVASATAVIMPVINSLDNPKSLLYSLGGLVLIGLIFLIGYGIASDEVTAKYISYDVTTPTMSKLIGGGLETTYMLLTIACIGIVFSEVYKALK
ncbi:MAG: hypothetical protein OEX02_02035 [Cyclobacteriaceae bacterium]|nr:hypothetical protein [Cyclobacteriaceae bacterium]